MMAKWYHNAIKPVPNALLKMCAMPTASDGAPPVRPSSVFSPTAAANPSICSGVTVKPHPRITSAADCTVPPSVESGELIAK
jgi:hypothetical protein